MQKIVVSCTLLYSCISPRYSDLSLAEKLSQPGCQLSIGSAKCSGIHSEYIFAFYVEKEISINSHFMLYFVP